MNATPIGTTGSSKKSSEEEIYKKKRGKMEEIIIDVAPDGTTKITTKGFKGKSCKEATKAIEEALGTVVNDIPTPEMHVHEQTRVKAH